MTVVLRAEGLSVGHGSRVVLHDVDVQLQAGRTTAVLGANGCGKSTLLRCMGGLHPAQAGRVLLDGQPLASHRARRLARQVGFLPQAPVVPAGVTVRDLVSYGRHPHRGLLGGPGDADRDAVAWALQVTTLEPLADRPVGQLSGGERQRAWLAMALAQRTSVLLLDEPTTFLDVRHQLEVLTLVRSLAHDHHLAVGVVLHDLNQAAEYADHLVVLADGGVATQGSPTDVLTAATIATAFGVDAEVHPDERTGRPQCRFRAPTTTVAAW